MHSWTFNVLVLWQTGLALALVIFALRSKHVVNRALAVDAIAPLIVTVLAMVAVYRTQPGFLDVALIIAMLGFVQAVATVRLVEGRISRDD